MGQNWWWLKLFLYLLDVRTLNALVLYNKSVRIHLEQAAGQHAPMSIAQLKMKLVEDL
jgi:hypothetical protein